jgi:hypothetical protein
VESQNRRPLTDAYLTRILLPKGLLKRTEGVVNGGKKLSARSRVSCGGNRVAQGLPGSMDVPTMAD